MLGINSKAAGDNVMLLSPSGCTFAGVDSVYSAALTLNEWHHVAASYTGTVLRVFHNGVMVLQQTGAPSMALSSCVMGIGAEFDSANGGGVANFFPGHIDELRVTARVARYTSEFAAPTQPFADARTPLPMDASNVQVAVYE
jgi:hypothetical protein